ncbi:hypothetical protein ACLKA7_000552 [Drosophila subpalustris]
MRLLIAILIGILYIVLGSDSPAEGPGGAGHEGAKDSGFLGGVGTEVWESYGAEFGHLEKHQFKIDFESSNILNIWKMRLLIVAFIGILCLALSFAQKVCRTCPTHDLPGLDYGKSQAGFT